MPAGTLGGQAPAASRGQDAGEIGNNTVAPECGLKGSGRRMYAAVLERFRWEGMQYAKVLAGLAPAHAATGANHYSAPWRTGRS